MPNIKEYTAPDRRTTLPAEGFAAYETAARRIGPAYNAAAADVKDIGKLLADSYKERLWPWGFLDLRNSGRGNGSRAGGGGGVKIQNGDSDPFGQFRSHGQTSRAAGRLGAIEDYEGPATGIAKNAEFVDGSGNTINRGQVGRGLYQPNGGLAPLPANKVNPYGQFDSTKYGYAPPPPVPPPLDANGNPILDNKGNPLTVGGGLGFSPGENNGGYYTDSRTQPPVPSWWDMHSQEYVRSDPAPRDQSNDPVPLPAPVKQLSDWIGEKVDEGGGGYNDTGL